MKVAVTDACIFIDLIEIKIISDFFDLDLEIHTTVDVLGELFPEHQQILNAYKKGGQLTLHNLNSDEIKEMEDMSLPKGLSSQDQTVLYMASKLADVSEVIVLSSDGIVRTQAGKLSIEYHGMIWIVDELIRQEIIPNKKGASKLQELLDTNKMYRYSETKREINKRIKKWNK